MRSIPLGQHFASEEMASLSKDVRLCSYLLSGVLHDPHVRSSTSLITLAKLTKARSNTGATVATHAASELSISRIVAVFSTITVYLLGQAVGGLLFPPLAESFGHRTIYVTSTFAFAVLCLVIGLGHDRLAPVIVGRLLSGFLSAIPATVACGSIENMWDEKARIMAIHAWISCAVLGLACGPPVATYISTSLGW